MKGVKSKLRALEPSDINALYAWENNHTLWHLSNTTYPFSTFILEEYIQQATTDIFTSKQQRFIIEDIFNHAVIGCIDLCDFDPLHKRAGVGILIQENYQHQGYAKEALQLLITHAKKHLNLHQLYCHILTDNTASFHLFTQAGFQLCGEKKQWQWVNGLWKDEYTLQHLLNH